MTQVVRYALDDEKLVVAFEIEPAPGFQPAGATEIAGKLKDAVQPLVAGARVVLEKARETGPDEVQVKFGVKASGTANWIVAKAATEGNFEVTLTWHGVRDQRSGSPADTETP